MGIQIAAVLSYLQTCWQTGVAPPALHSKWHPGTPIYALHAVNVTRRLLPLAALLLGLADKFQSCS